MTVTTLATKFGYTSIDGTTNDMNTYPLDKISCDCSGSKEACGCPTPGPNITPVSLPVWTVDPKGQVIVTKPKLTPGPLGILTSAPGVNGIIDKAKAAYNKNPGLVLAAVAVVLYLATKKK